MKKIVLVEDDADFASTLKECLELDGQFEVVAIPDSEEEALQWINSADLSELHGVLVDLSLPELPGASSRTSTSCGIGIVERLRRAPGFSGVIVVLTNSRDPDDARRALKAGCDGYLCKFASSSSIPSIIKELKLALSGSVMMFSRELRHVFLRGDISVKEAQLMELVDSGCSWSAIAAKLGYSSANAAAAIGFRVFSKLLRADKHLQESAETDPADSASTEELPLAIENRRKRALERWRSSKFGNASERRALATLDFTPDNSDEKSAIATPAQTRTVTMSSYSPDWQLRCRQFMPGL